MRRAVALAMVLLILTLPPNIAATTTLYLDGDSAAFSNEPGACVYNNNDANWGDDYVGETLAWHTPTDTDCYTTSFGYPPYTWRDGDRNAQPTAASQYQDGYSDQLLSGPSALLVLGYDKPWDGQGDRRDPVFRSSVYAYAQPVDGEDAVINSGVFCAKAMELNFEHNTMSPEIGDSITWEPGEGAYENCESYLEDAHDLIESSTHYQDARYVWGWDDVDAGEPYSGTVGDVATGLATLGAVASVLLLTGPVGWITAGIGVVFSAILSVFGVGTGWGPGLEGWMAGQPHSLPLPLPATCESYELRILDPTWTNIQANPAVFRNIGDGQMMARVNGDWEGSNDEFRAVIQEASPGQPESIKITYNNPERAGAFAWMITCRNAIVNPNSLDTVCTSPQYQGDWQPLSDDSGACCYAPTEGNTVTDDTGEEWTCIDDPDEGFFWTSELIEDNQACDGGDRDGIAGTNYCCRQDMFEPYQPDEPFFCDQGEIKLVRDQPFDADGFDPWAWDGDGTFDESGTWLECTASAATSDHGTHLCTIDPASSDTVYDTCFCGQPGAQENCGPSEYTDSWYCAPGPSDGDRAFWTQDATTPGACSDDRSMGSLCCNPGIYAVTTQPYSNDDSVVETLGCFDGVLLEEGFAPLKTVRAEVG